MNSPILPQTSGWNIARRQFLVWTASATLFEATHRTSRARSNADRIIVLTFDDAVKSHRTTVVPLLKELGFGATFFVCHNWLENSDWSRNPDGSLTGRRVLPNKITFGTSVQPSTGKVEMELWLRNDSREKLSGLRTQICVMLKGARDFNSQTNDNKIFRSPACAVRSAKENRWVLMAWDRCGRAWGNSPVPCMHADPVLADCLPGQTVRVCGRLWFYEGSDIDSELGRARQTFAALPVSR